MSKRDPAIVSKTMSAIKGKNTGIELKLRKALTKRGLRYSLYSKKVIGHPDILFEGVKVAVFADSEFWHGYDFEENKAKLTTNPSYWVNKIERNIARDKQVNEELTALGYKVLRYWGKEIEKETERIADEIEQTVKRRQEAFKRSKHIDEFTTLGYVRKGNSYLLIHRNKEEGDINEGKWLGIGGHLEEGETPLRCMKRELKEETGLNLKKARYVGKVDFLNSLYPSERMYLFEIEAEEGELIDCDEGELCYVDKEKMLSLPMWEGDKTFLPYLDKKEKPFSLLLCYEGDELTEIIGPFWKKR